MSLSSETLGGAAESSAAPARRRARVAAWPLWATIAGAFGFAGTIIFDVRPAAEAEAWQSGEEYTVTVADILGLEVVAGRLGWTAGLLAVAALLAFAGVWHRHVETRFPSAAARTVTAGVIATAGASLLGYGWKGALANYLGPELGTYDEQGLFVYYMLTDFGAYLPWFGVVVASLAVVWMAFAERLISRILGVVSGVFGLGLTALTLISGVPGIPGTLIQGWLIIFGLWLAFGRSRITQPTAVSR